MPDFNKLESWLEPALRRHLGPVGAPPELRGRVAGRNREQSGGTIWGLAVVAAALAFAAVTAVAWTPTGGPSKPVIRQAEMAQARALVRANVSHNAHAGCNVCHTI